MAATPDRSEARQQLTRLRWRMRGAWQWPAFVGLTLLGALCMHLMPIQGTATPFLGALILCGFVNLTLIAVVAPPLGRQLRRRRPELPKGVAANYAGTGLLTAGLVLLAGLGVAHRDDVAAARDGYAEQLAAARRFATAEAPAAFRANIGREEVWQQAPGFYRTCVPGPDPKRSFCMFVDTTGPNPSVSRDADQQPNARIAGAENPGRRGG